MTSSDRPSILIVTFDCLRSDHLGCYGYDEIETPHFDRLAAEGVRFEAAYTPAPNAWVSHASLFTGCYPARHGLRSPLGRLVQELPTLAEVLGSAGYETFGLTDHARLSPRAGFARGFETYHGTDPAAESKGRVCPRPASETLRLVSEWIESRAGASGAQPFFVWVHHCGMHSLDFSAGQRQADVSESDRRQQSRLIGNFDGKIASADRELLGPLLKLVEKAAAPDKLAVVAAGAHGEDLSAVERGEPGHDRHLGEEVVRVPLVCWSPGRLPAGRVVSDPVSLVDVFSTLAELSGAADPARQRDGASLLTGVGAGQDAGASDEQCVYFENPYRGFLGLRRGALKLVLSLPADRPSDDASLYEEPMQEALERLFEPPAVAELFDLEQDPEERANLANGRADDVEAMCAALGALASGEVADDDPYSEDDAEIIEERLRDLGYL